MAINSRGDIVGSYCDPHFGTCQIIANVVLNNRGFLFGRGSDDDQQGESDDQNDGRERHRVFKSIDFPGATVTQAWKVSPRGKVVGFFQDQEHRNHGFLLDKGGFSRIEFPGATDTFATGINPRGDIVGFYCNTACDAVRIIGRHGFLLHNGQFSTIDFPGAQFMNAFAITPRGDIAGAYRDFANKNHGFLISKNSDDRDARRDRDDG